MIDNNISMLTHNWGLLHRPRLDDLFSEAAKHNFIKVTAGSGYGKTQAVSMFLDNNDCQVAWMQLSKLDNLPERFWNGFLDAFFARDRNSSLGLKQLNLPRSLMEFDRFLKIFSRYVQGGNRFIFVFDDFHSIYEKSVIEFIENLISAKINNFCVVLISRKKIDFQSDIHNHFTEAELCFTLSETDEYLRKQDVLLTEAETKKIYAYTEGWPLAIYLICLNLKENNSAMIDAITVTQTIVFQLIEEDIFAKYSPEAQEFLVRLSLLENFPASLVQTLSNANIDIMKEVLETNMFVQYNTFSGKYQLHNMFISFLERKQFHLDRQTVYDVYLTAAKWYHENNFTIDAMTYYEKCGNYEGIWQIIFQESPKRRPKDNTSLFIRFIDSFPKEFVKKHPMIRVIRASYLLNNLELEPAAKDMLDLIEEYSAMPDTVENKSIMGEAYIVLALIRQTQKNIIYIDYYKMAAECLPNGSIRDYRHTKIIDSNNSINPTSLDSNEIVMFQKGLFEAIPYVSKIMNGFGYGVEYLASAEVEYFKGNLKKSQENAFEAIYHAKEKEQNDIICNALFLLMRISSAKGNYDQTLDYIEQLREYAGNDNSALGILDIAEGWFFIRLRREEKVARWLLNDSLNFKTHPPISVGRDRLIRAYYFLKMERYDALLAFSKQVDKLFMEKGLWLDLLSIRLFIVIAHYYLGDMPQCVAAFQSLYDLVSENHFIMQFIEMGNDTCNVINNIKKAGGHTIPEQWLNNIYSKASTYSKRQAFYVNKYNSENAGGSATSIRLTSREKEVLNNLAQGLTREEIAESLNISPNTVKSTLQNIYNKLGAVNSTDAIRIAIKMNLIEH